MVTMIIVNNLVLIVLTLCRLFIAIILNTPESLGGRAKGCAVSLVVDVSRVLSAT